MSVCFHQGYLMQRIHSSAEIQSNVSLSNGRLDNTALAKLISHLKSLSKGSYLYLKLTLDLIEGGYLVLKSSSFKVRKDGRAGRKQLEVEVKWIIEYRITYRCQEVKTPEI